MNLTDSRHGASSEMLGCAQDNLSAKIDDCPRFRIFKENSTSEIVI
ncbi:MAG: hypothetical protein ACW9W4_09415 [Candidatus Nitrosopumilus sp. bin_7KS]